jgi:hypothetical protein
MNFLRLYLRWTNEITRSIFNKLNWSKTRYLPEKTSFYLKQETIKSGNTDNCSACENKYMKRKSLYMI